MGWRTGVMLGAAAAALGMVGTCGAPYLMNDFELSRYVAELDAVVLPEGSVEVARHSDVGILDGNGNHCDFFVGRAVDSTLGEDAFRAAVAPTDVVTETDEHWGRLPALRTLVTTSPEPEANRYYLMSFHQTMSGFAFQGDLRCH